MRYGYCPSCLDRWVANGRQRGADGVILPSRPLHPACERALKALQ